VDPAHERRKKTSQMLIGTCCIRSYRLRGNLLLTKQFLHHSKSPY
jgi:hypothetical protein